jgi:hypothetical protein
MTLRLQGTESEGVGDDTKVVESSQAVFLQPVLKYITFSSLDGFRRKITLL